jgi:phage tail P2-like protein
MASILPPSATAQERAIDEACEARIDGIGSPLRTLWNPETISADLLPWLAWALSVDVWDPQWPEGVKREVVSQSIYLHSIKGTVASIRLAIAAAGYGDCVIIEGEGDLLRDGSVFRNGTEVRGGGEGAWARYRVKLDRLMTIRQGQYVREILRKTAPARCELVALEYPTASAMRDGTIYRNGIYSRGAV